MDRAQKKRSIFKMGSLFSVDVDTEIHDKAIKFAMYNGLAILLVVISSVAAYSVYIILLPFIKPLLWALLVGSALHPFKQLLSTKFKNCIVTLETSSNQTYCYILFFPIIFIFRLADLIGDFFVSHISVIVKTLGAVCSAVGVYMYTPHMVINSLWFFMGLNKALLNFTLNLFSNIVLVSATTVGFISALYFLWKPENRHIFSASSVIVWVAVTAYISSFSPTFRIPLFVLFQFSLCSGFLYTFFPRQDTTLKNKPDEEDEKDIKKKEKNNNSSVTYIKWLALACVMVLLVSLPSFPYILLLLLALYIAKHFCSLFGVTDAIFNHVNYFFTGIQEWLAQRKEIILAEPLQNLLKIFGFFWRKKLSVILTYCDSVASIAVILGLLLAIIFGSVFLSVQAYKESVYVVQTGGSIINKTIVENPELLHILPEGWEPRMDVALNNGYIYVRDALAKFLRSLLKDKGISESKASELEKNVLELWDRVYQAWVMPLGTQPDPTGPTVTTDAVALSYSTLMERLRNTSEVISLQSIYETLLKDNMVTLTAGLDSLWSLLKGNLTLLLNITSTFFWFIFDGGMSVINFTFNMIVFLTALFYLLNTSRSLYKPVEIITKISPKYGNKLAVAAENACQEVLAASAKLAIFYGMWTWLIHTAFMSNIVYLPAIFAAILGGVPVLGTYWVCIPAVLDLWLIQGNGILAIFLLVAQLLPTMIVDSTVYNEIQGGHPYLTGLSVAGGLFWLGMEGAVVGPLLLCFLFVILNMASAIAHEDPPTKPVSI